jgi:hypothetical protein
MRAWLRSVVDTILGRVPGKTGRLDTATRMAMAADFVDRREVRPTALLWTRERDDNHLVKPIEPAADRTLFKQLLHRQRSARPRR